MTEFSAVITAWNSGPLLLQCMSSLFNLNLAHHFETIVVDSSSEDDTMEILMLSGILHYCEKWRVHPRIFRFLYLLNVFVSPLLFPVRRRLLKTRINFKERILVAAFQVKAMVLEKPKPA